MTGRSFGPLPGSKEKVTLRQLVSFSASACVLSLCLPLVSVFIPRFPEAASPGKMERLLRQAEKTRRGWVVSRFHTHRATKRVSY